jgi:hypothetical protein
MAWGFRRSAKIGPIRLNFSKGGVGASIGIPGARVGVDSRGRRYFSGYFHGLTYRQSFGKMQAPSMPTMPKFRWLLIGAAIVAALSMLLAQ